MTPENFNPRSPSGLRPLLQDYIHTLKLFQSTQPEWAATADGDCTRSEQPISIHAARVGCDRALESVDEAELEISIHAARVGCDVFAASIRCIISNFNPRSPSGLRQHEE